MLIDIIYIISILIILFLITFVLLRIKKVEHFEYLANTIYEIGKLIERDKDLDYPVEFGNIFGAILAPELIDIALKGPDSTYTTEYLVFLSNEWKYYTMAYNAIILMETNMVRKKFTYVADDFRDLYMNTAKTIDQNKRANILSAIREKSLMTINSPVPSQSC